MTAPVTVDLEFRGATKQMLTDKSPELGMVGSAGTGKTTAALYKMHLASLLSAGCKSLIARKEAVSLAATTLQAFNRDVAAEALASGITHWFGGSAREPAAYHYANGSMIQVGGLDKPERIMSAEFDRIMVDEGTDITEDAYQMLLTRLRGRRAKYRQIILCCNPQQPTHWVKRRADRGQLNLLTSYHRDNPAYFDADGVPTTAGAEYMARLDALQGVKRLRLRDGKWAAAEGVIYEEWDEALHVIPRFEIPASWPRYWAIDFGYTNPFVCQMWAEDPDGRLYMYREFYRTQRLVEDHAQDVMQSVATKDEQTGRWVWHEPKPQAVICDHDAEDRATWERHTKLPTKAATKTVSDGLQAVSARLRIAGTKPRLFFLKDSLVRVDQSLRDRGLPSSTPEEFPGYIWDTSTTKLKETPLKNNDHGCDTTRYVVAERDIKREPRVRWLQ